MRLKLRGKDSRFNLPDIKVRRGGEISKQMSTDREGGKSKVLAWHTAILRTWEDLEETAKVAEKVWPGGWEASGAGRIACGQVKRCFRKGLINSINEVNDLKSRKYGTNQSRTEKSQTSVRSTGASFL